MKKLILIFVFLLITINTYSQTLIFKPLEANVFEPRIGSIYEFDDKKLRLDVGNSIDLFQSNDKLIFDKLNFGTEFYISSRLRSEGNMKFPVETSDYYFGINGTSLITFDNYALLFRLRLGHISSHMIDGYTDKDWRFKKDPFVYSREFVDFVTSIKKDFLRLYLGITAIFSTIPKDVNKIIPQLGFDTDIELSENIRFISGYDFKLNGYNDKYNGINSFKLGFRYLTYKNLAVELNYGYYSGLSMHGMFYKEKDNYHSIGFFVIFY